MKNSFRKESRLRHQKDITTVLSTGERWRCNIFSVIYMKNGLPNDRMGVLVSKKNGKAVQRVRIKRVYRAVFTDVAPEGDIGYDILIRPFYGRDHRYWEVIAQYELWRTQLLEKSSL